MIQIVDFNLCHGTCISILALLGEDFMIVSQTKTYIHTQALLPFAFVIFQKKTPVGETGVYYPPAGQIIALFTF